MIQRIVGLARPSHASASMLVAVFSACALAMCAFVTTASAAQAVRTDPRVVRVPSSLDADGDRINDRFERALDTADFKSMPNAIMQARSAIAINKGMGQATSPVVDMIVFFDHAPNSVDVAGIERLGFTAKEVYSRTIYGVHVIGPVAHGSQSLRDLTAAVKGVVYIAPNDEVPLDLEHSTRQIGARQSWPVYENYNEGLPLTGDPDRSIAIMDTGMDGTHPDLNGGTATTPGDKIMAWYDATYGSATPTDNDGHGSHVSGIAAGTGESSGLAYGIGFIPLTLRAADYGPLLKNDPTILELNNDNIPVNTTGWSSGAPLALSAWWSLVIPGTSNTFGVFDQTNGIDGLSVGSTTVDSGTQQPAQGAFTVPQGFSGDYYANFTSSGDQYMGFAIHFEAPQTAIGDGFNLLTGVSPTSSLVGVEVDDVLNPAGLPLSSIFSGFEYVSENQARYNIGALNMSFGGPEIDPAMDTAVNNLVSQGIVCCVAAGNDRPAVGIGSPGSASAAITVAAVGNENQITDYSSLGAPGQSKPDVSAPGGSYPLYFPGSGVTADASYTHDEAITSVDSNTDDSISADPFITGATTIYQPNVYPNSYTDDEGTSMATPHVTGSAALLEQALATPGALAGENRTGADEAQLIKALLEMTSTDTNVPADVLPSPVLRHLFKDSSEGYGKINDDAAISAVLRTYVPGDTASATFGRGYFDQQAFAEHVTLQGGTKYVFTMHPQSNVNVGAEFDLLLYSGNYVVDGAPSDGGDGDCVQIAYSNVYQSVTQQMTYTPKTTETDFIVVKRQSGAGTFTLTCQTESTPTNGGTPTVSSIPLAYSTVNVVSQATGAPIRSAVVTITDATTAQQLNMSATAAAGKVVCKVPINTPLTVTASALGYYTNSISTSSGIAGSNGSATVTMTPSHVFTRGLQMVSVPYSYGSSLAQETLPSLYSMATWVPSQDGYVLSPSAPADQFHLGNAYWVQFRQPISIPILGSKAAAGTYTLSLSAGWNMIGTPYTNPAPLTHASINVGGVVTAFPNAVKAGSVGALYAYNSAVGAYAVISPTGTMQPYVGYWIYASSPCRLTVAGS